MAPSKNDEKNATFFEDFRQWNDFKIFFPFSCDYVEYYHKDQK